MELVKTCFPDGDKVNEFIEVFSQKTGDVKKYLRESGDYEIDLFTAALYLKFNYGLAGFYYDPGTAQAGALSLYGEGSNYAKTVNSYANKLNSYGGKVNLVCFDDEEFVDEILWESCQLEPKNESCQSVLKSLEI